MFLKYFIVILISACGSCLNVANKKIDVEEAFMTSAIVPDVVPRAPKNLAMVKYPYGVEAHLGNELRPTQVAKIPSVTWNTKPNCFYTLAMVDPDVPSRADPKQRSLKHWLVVNMPGEVPYIGDTIAEYIGSAPLPNTGLHRYVFLVFEQPAPLWFDEPRVTNMSIKTRPSFSISKFAEKYNLTLVAGNFFLAQYDNYVPIVHAQYGDYSLLKYLAFD